MAMNMKTTRVMVTVTITATICSSNDGPHTNSSIKLTETVSMINNAVGHNATAKVYIWAQGRIEPKRSWRSGTKYAVHAPFLRRAKSTGTPKLKEQ